LNSCERAAAAKLSRVAAVDELRVTGSIPVGIREAHAVILIECPCVLVPRLIVVPGTGVVRIVHIDIGRCERTLSVRVRTCGSLNSALASRNIAAICSRSTRQIEVEASWIGDRQGLLRA